MGMSGLLMSRVAPEQPLHMTGGIGAFVTGRSPYQSRSRPRSPGWVCEVWTSVGKSVATSLHVSRF